jgi:hypothetical protein
MGRKAKSLLYHICRAMIVLIIFYYAVYYIYNIKLKSRYAFMYEGFQGPPQWNGPPFISGGVFQSLCDYSIDDRYAIIPYDDELKKGNRVFMKVNDIPTFLQSPPSVPVTVVISNSDETFDDTLMMKLKPYVTAVYAINCSAKGAKQIPIGFRDDQYTPHKDLVDILANPKVPGEKTTLCLVNFLVETNGGERQRAVDRFSSESWATVDKSYLNYGLSKATVFTIPETIQKRLDYYSILKKTKFVVCPPGRGVDTHRVYETLFFGGIPIIKTSFLDPMYEKLGGCWIVNDWTDVTQEACNKRWAAKGEPTIQYDASYWLK